MRPDANGRELIVPPRAYGEDVSHLVNLDNRAVFLGFGHEPLTHRLILLGQGQPFYTTIFRVSPLSCVVQSVPEALLVD
jgi:hypothetical protein